MKSLGLEFYVADKDRGCIITTVLSPPGLQFEKFYDYLFKSGYIIYPGKTAKVDSFRIGTIGQVYPSDMEDLCAMIKLAFEDQGIKTPIQYEPETVKMVEGIKAAAAAA